MAQRKRRPRGQPSAATGGTLWRGDGDSDALNFVFFKIILDLIWGLEGDTVAGVDGGLGVPTIETIDT